MSAVASEACSGAATASLAFVTMPKGIDSFNDLQI